MIIFYGYLPSLLELVLHFLPGSGRHFTLQKQLALFPSMITCNYAFPAIILIGCHTAQRRRLEYKAAFMDGLLEHLI